MAFSHKPPYYVSKPKFCVNVSSLLEDDELFGEASIEVDYRGILELLMLSVYSHVLCWGQGD